MSQSFIYVKPSTDPSRVKVLTELAGELEIPVYVLANAAGDTAYVDPFSGAVGVIEQEHMKIHKGEGFTVSKRFSIANVGGIHEFLAIVPLLVFPHFRSFTVTSDGGPNDVDFYEGATYSATGTEVTPYNNNRNSSNTADMEVYDTPTLVTDGALLEPILIPGTKQAGSFGSEASNEWILRQNETYMIRLTNNTAGAGTSNFTINLFFYE